jgi:zinc/manganese transport system permease protein
MNDRLADLLSHLFAFSITAHLLSHDFVQQALVAGALLGLVAGLVGPFIVMRQMSFAVHGSSELSLTGAAFALLVGLQVGAGALVGSALAAALFGILGQRAKERDSAIGVVLAFGLGLAVLFIHLYPGHTGTSFALLTGQIVGVGYSGLVTLAVISIVVVVVLGVCYSPVVVRHRRPGSRRGARRAGCVHWASCSRRWSASSRPRECKSSARYWWYRC